MKEEVTSISSCVTITLQVYLQTLFIVTLSLVTNMDYKWQSLFSGALSQIHSKQWLEHLSTTCINSTNDWVISPPELDIKVVSTLLLLSKPAMGKRIVQNSSVLKISQGWTLRRWIRRWKDLNWSRRPWQYWWQHFRQVQRRLQPTAWYPPPDSNCMAGIQEPEGEGTWQTPSPPDPKLPTLTSKIPETSWCSKQHFTTSPPSLAPSLSFH